MYRDVTILVRNGELETLKEVNSWKTTPSKYKEDKIRQWSLTGLVIQLDDNVSKNDSEKSLETSLLSTTSSTADLTTTTTSDRKMFYSSKAEITPPPPMLSRANFASYINIGSEE